MYKIYFENDSMMMTLSEVVELTQATPAEARKIFTSRCCVVNGFEIINYSNEVR